MKPGDEIRIDGQMAKNPFLDGLHGIVKGRGVPEWLELDGDEPEGARRPGTPRADITYPIEEQLIVELYSK